MRNKQLSWPLVTANVHGSYEDEKFDVDVEAQQQPKTVEPAHLKPNTKLCESDLDDQRFDRSLRTKTSISTLASSCTTLCGFDAPLMEDSTLLASELPSHRGPKWYRAIRWRICTQYRKLFSVVLLANLGMMILMVRRINSSKRPTGAQTRPELTDILTAVSINLTASIAIRNEHVINLLFRIFVTHATVRLPLRIRRVFAKVYHFGGVHSGGGVSAVAWYGMYTWYALRDFVMSDRSKSNVTNMTLTAIIWLLMFSLTVAAYPRIRANLHNWFEVTHRFCGWLILLLFWAQTLLFCFISSGSEEGRPNIVQIPTFWALIIMSVFVAYPWVLVRRVRVRCEKLSTHAIRIHVSDERIMPPCRVVAISHSPLKETHKFATISEPDGRPGYSMVISRAGDWTAKIIENPPSKIWIKGQPAWGVLRIATMFEPVVIVATGSGIGPCLGLFNGCPGLKCRVGWQARSPQETYGKDIVNAVLKADSHARIVDSDVQGRKDMTRLALKLYQESNAEAVIVISNTEGTYQVVRELESRGIPAFGPIWDS